MALERYKALPFKIFIGIQRFSTRWSDSEETLFGRHVIQPRGGKMVDIKTPQGQVLMVGEKDIIHLRGPKGEGQVVTTFTSLTLPEGYKIVQPMKGESGAKPKPSQ